MRNWLKLQPCRLLDGHPDGSDLVAPGVVAVYPFDVPQLDEMLGRMRRYTERGKRKTDLADASLCWLAWRTGLREILTTDAGDFGRYRLPDGSALRML